MSLEFDEEIMQDFLVEAGEILEQLQEQLVDLENRPEDTELLNAIFRGYHTVKGGAGFLALTELVNICHGAENVFDAMRNGQRILTPELMDVILQATDVVVDMFEKVKLREPLDAAPAELIAILHKLSKPDTAGQHIFSPEPDSAAIVGTTEAAIDVGDGLIIEDDESGDIDQISEDEFEALLDELHGGEGVSKVSAPVSAVSEADDISDDEFEALLDNLHGTGQFGVEESVADSSSAVTASSNSDEITDDEFEALLDQLHGEGKSPIEAADNKPIVKVVDTPVVEKPSTSVKAENKAITKAPSHSQPAAKAAVPEVVKKDQNKPSVSPQAETTVRVDTKRLDQIMNMVGELVLVRNRLLSLGINNPDESMAKAIANLDAVTGDLQGAVMKTRMQPIKKVFGRFPRVVRDLARTLKKEITLELVGEETDLDKNLVEALADPLVHLVRNSVDHGIEMPEEREAQGKPRMGIVKLSASQEGDHILLTIDDDGKGMDSETLKEIAISRGVLDADSAARMSDAEAFNLIFAPGFSTKVEISEVSGRGVGMDVVKTKINQLNGSVSITSELGKGTRLEIKVPLTLAILPTLMIIVGAQTFALSLGSVSEIINMDISKTHKVDGQLTIIVRSKAIPLFYLGDWLSRIPVEVDRSQGHVVVMQMGTQQVGFVVDSLIGQEEVVIKPLDALLKGTPGMAGATITSDGGIALILDIPSLLKRYA
jgi:two-component system chemotaxis sensor kinase CheA